MESAWNWYLRAQRLRRDRARGEAMIALLMGADHPISQAKLTWTGFHDAGHAVDGVYRTSRTLQPNNA
jgi:hypothetical protein